MIKELFKKAFFSLISVFLSNLSNTFLYLSYYLAFSLCTEDIARTYHWPYFRPYDLSLLVWAVLAFMVSHKNEGQVYLGMLGYCIVLPCFMLSLISSKLMAL